MGLGSGESVTAAGVEQVRMGTTVATNALLERTGERTVLVVTKGFRDALRIGYQNRPKIFDREIVLPEFNLGSAAVALGLCRAAVAATAAHLKSARFEHLGQSLGESLPTLRAQLATMQIDTDGLSARVDDLVDHLERPRDTTLLRVLETKAAAGDIAIDVTSAAMRTCGGAAFSKHTSIERLFRDAHAGAVMAPTGDVLREFISRAILGMPLF